MTNAPFDMTVKEPDNALNSWMALINFWEPSEQRRERTSARGLSMTPDASIFWTASTSHDQPRPSHSIPGAQLTGSIKRYPNLVEYVPGQPLL